MIFFVSKYNFIFKIFIGPVKLNFLETLAASASAGIAVGIMVLLGLTVITIVHLNKKIKGTWIPCQVSKSKLRDIYHLSCIIAKICILLFNFI